jgi:anti-sigma B factor antagonist
MRLAFSTRAVGDVLVVQCAGRIVAGVEAETLHTHLKKSIAEMPDLVLVLDKIEFVDSSGLGTLVRLVANARSAGGDIKLCALPKHVANTLRITNLNRIFEVHETEADAITACYQRRTRREAESPRLAKEVLCVEESPDLLVYLSELLRRSGYRVLAGRNLYDARILLRATKPALVIAGPRLQTADGKCAKEWLAGMDCTIPLLVLGEDLSTLEAGEAASRLLTQVRALMPEA